MWTSGYYPSNTVVIKGLYIGQRLHLEEEFITSTLSRVARTTFFGTQYRKRNPRLVEYLGHSLGYTACPLIKTACTAYPEKDIGLNPLCTKLRHSGNMKVHRHIFFNRQKYK